MNFDVYDEETLSITCPVCCAAETGRCLEHSNRGLDYLAAPHRKRVLKAHGVTDDAETKRENA
jgi:hypothetical protein